MVPGLLGALDSCWSGQQCSTQLCQEPLWRESEPVCRGHNFSICLLSLSAGRYYLDGVAEAGTSSPHLAPLEEVGGEDFPWRGVALVLLMGETVMPLCSHARTGIKVTEEPT